MKNPGQHKPARGVNRPPTFLPALAAWLGVACWVAGVWWASSLTGPEAARINVWNLWDKASHFAAFALGGGILAAALGLSTSWTGLRVCAAAWCGLSLFAALDEWHQLSTPQRSGADPADWMADTLGAVAGVACTRVARRIYVRSQRKNSPAPPGT